MSQIMFALNQNAQFLSIESSVDTKIPTSETRVSLSLEMGRRRFGLPCCVCTCRPGALSGFERILKDVWCWSGGWPCWQWTQDTGGVALGQHSPGTQAACLGHHERVTWVHCAPRVSVHQCSTHWMVKNSAGIHPRQMSQHFTGD